MSRWQNRAFKWLLPALLVVTQTSPAADRTTTTTQKTIRTAPATKTSLANPTQTARQLKTKNTAAAPALRTMIQTHRLSLSAADRYLAQAKYSTIDRANAVRATYNVRQAAASLLRSTVPAQDAYLQLRCWHYSAADAAAAIVRTYPAATAEEIAESMAAEGASDEDIVEFLRARGYTAQQIAAFLEQNLNRAGDQIMLLLFRVFQDSMADTNEDLQYIYTRVNALFNTAGAAGNWLIENVGMTWETAATVLVRAGYATEQIATWLKNTVGASAPVIAGFLKNVTGISAKKAVELLREIGFSFGDTWDAVKSKFGSSTKKLVGWMKKEGASAEQIARLLVNKVGATAGQVFDRLLEAGYGMQSVLNVLATVFEWTQDQILALMATKNQMTLAVIGMVNAMFSTPK